jgi:hypothetical protein
LFSRNSDVVDETEIIEIWLTARHDASLSLRARFRGLDISEEYRSGIGGRGNTWEFVPGWLVGGMRGRLGDDVVGWKKDLRRGTILADYYQI